jgi:hypothetical protein
MPQTVREISPLQRFPLTGIAVALAPPNNAAGIDAASSLVVLDRTLPARSPEPFAAGFDDARSRGEPLSRLPLSPGQLWRPFRAASTKPPAEQAARLPRPFPVAVDPDGLDRRSGVASPTAKPCSSCESVRTRRGCPRHAADPLLGVRPL